VPLVEIEKELAKQQQGARNDLTSTSNDVEVERPGATARAAKKIGVSEPTLARAMTVMQKAKPEEKEQLRSGESYLQLNP